MLSVAARFPVADGLKLTWIWQLAPAASDGVQVLVCVKSAAFGPLRLIVSPFIGAESPTLDTFTTCALPDVPTKRRSKERLDTDSCASGVRASICAVRDRSRVVSSRRCDSTYSPASIWSRYAAMLSSRASL